MSRSIAQGTAAPAVFAVMVAGLGGIGPAAAIPMVPLVPPCGLHHYWHLPDLLTIHQDNDLDVLVTFEGGTPARAQYTAKDGRLITGRGDAERRGETSDFQFAIRWRETGGSNNYSVHIADDGSMSGSTINERFVSNYWTGSPKATC